MLKSLPFPGHTWSLSQHAIGLEATTLYDFLKCAAPFEGEVKGYSQKITSLMIASGVLTSNEREGAPDAWRDYQQLLAELGLIYSTKIVPALTLTELGHFFLAGEIGFSELIGIQALRYQYPNGQKSTIQGRLRDELSVNSIPVPSTLTELHMNFGVLLKPGTLILRVILELLSAGQNPVLTVSECQAFLLPCKGNGDWPDAVFDVVENRKNPQSIENVNRHARRNVQDWFKLLSKSDYFEIFNVNNLRLSSYALSNIDLMHSLVDVQEAGMSFWIPTGFDAVDRSSWFDWFGHIPYEMQESLRSDLANDSEYVAGNYISGGDEEDQELSSLETSSINLTSLDLEHLGRDTTFQPSADIETLVEGLRRGAQKRHAKTLLHDRIIKELAEKFIGQGATVESDPNSIDLYSVWPDNSSAIFEVKTVTRRSLQGRLRSAVGQVEEYAYRRKIAGAAASDRVIVINTELPSSAWQTNFLIDHLGIGLICKSKETYCGFAPNASSTKQYWA